LSVAVSSHHVRPVWVLRLLRLRLGGAICIEIPEVAYQLTAKDLLAVIVLSVRVIRYWALDVLV
jgi:hypothetical protein